MPIDHGSKAEIPSPPSTLQTWARVKKDGALFATEDEMVENRAYRELLRLQGHVPETRMVKVISTDKKQPILDTQVANHEVLREEEIVLSTCKRLCPVCIEEIVDHQDSIEFPIEGVEGDSDVFTKSSLGVPQGQMYTPLRPRITDNIFKNIRPGQRGTAGAGIPMGAGIGGRMPKYDLPFDDVDLDGVEVGDELGCGPGCLPHETESGLESFLYEDKLELMRDISRGDFSKLPPHDHLTCKFELCMEPACASYRKNARFSFRVARRAINAVVDVADKLKTKSPFLAGMASARRVKQAGASTAEALEFAQFMLSPTRTAWTIRRRRRRG